MIRLLSQRGARWVILLLALGGCAFGGPGQPTQLYMLTPLAAKEVQKTPDARGPGIWVGPVALPQYTNRPQIVTGNTGPQVQRASSALWAEPLQDNFARVLAENLSLLLATDQVAIFPWTSPMPVDYQVTVDVSQFLGELGGEASLTALWSLLGKNGKEILARKKSTFSQPTKSKDYDGFAAAMSQNLASLSREIAATITDLSQAAASQSR
jgi:uncharacterized lipoprotein YmbA